MKIPKARKLPSGKWFIQLRLDGVSISITRPAERACVFAWRQLDRLQRSGGWNDASTVRKIYTHLFGAQHLSDMDKLLGSSQTAAQNADENADEIAEARL